MFLGACNRIVVEINNRFRKIVMFSVVENMTIFIFKDITLKGKKKEHARLIGDQ